jgi:putative tricarboxylic transport membrane protein
MLQSRGDPTVFVTEPISILFLVIALTWIVLMVIPTLHRQKDKAAAEQ